jgi:hypothetical protein
MVTNRSIEKSFFSRNRFKLFAESKSCVKCSKGEVAKFIMPLYKHLM